MAFSQSLADRVRHALRNHRGIAEKKMFGSIVFLLNGKMLVGVWKSLLIVRLGPNQATTALTDTRPGVRPDWTTHEGPDHVEPDGLENDRQLVGWVEGTTGFVEALACACRRVGHAGFSSGRQSGFSARSSARSQESLFFPGKYE
ncbi:MAG TPA: TfoX/Sxy family protein [Pirellulales bacterium]|jgi:hypothetical protein|nr:TfoX/Sxy family protein [Pirellulales bacterium]